MDRKTETARQAAEAKQETLKRRRVAAGGETGAERRAREAREGLRAGAIFREREAAHALLVLTDEARRAGVEISPDADAEAAEAREVLAGVARYQNRRSSERLTAQDVGAIARAAASATVAGINRRASREARVSQDEYQDLVSELQLAILARTDMRGECPKWTAILPDAEAVTVARTLRRGDSLRGRWTGAMILTARQWRTERLERQKAEAAEVDAPDEAAIMAAQSARLEADTDAVARAFAKTGKPLTDAETDAVQLALSGLSRRELAARKGIAQDSLKKNAQRGRKALDTRRESGNVQAALRTVSARLDVARGSARDVIRYMDGAYREAAREVIADGWTDLLDSTERAGIPGRRCKPARPRHGKPRSGRGLLRVAPRSVAATITVSAPTSALAVLRYMDRMERAEYDRRALARQRARALRDLRALAGVAPRSAPAAQRATRKREASAPLTGHVSKPHKPYSEKPCHCAACKAA